MKIVHIIGGLNPAAGTTYITLRFVDALAKQGVLTEVHTLLPGPSDALCKNLVGYPAARILRRLGVSSDMRSGLTSVNADIFHNTGVWMMPNIYAGAIARERRIPLIFAPQGMFSEWAMAFSRWRKQIVWWCLDQRRAVEATTCFHALSESEAEDVRRLGFRQPIAVVPSGVDIPRSAPKPNRDEGLRRLLFLSRIHPKKGVLLLLKAWIELELSYPNWELIVAGADEGGHLARAKMVAGELGLQRVSFPGPVYDEAKSALYRTADLFVLPTYSENFGLVIAEALAHSIPVVTTTGTPWKGLHQRGCGWWIELGEGQLIEALRIAMELPEDQRKLMGERGRLWMQEAYSWFRMGEDMKGVCEWMLGGGSPPSCVITD